MGGVTLTSAITFGYISLALILAAFFRSQFKVLQKLFIPSAILAGFMLLLLGPGMLSIINIPEGTIFDNFVYHLLTAIFIALGLRGFGKKENKGGVGKTTTVLTKALIIQGAFGVLFTLILIGIFNPDSFPAFGSLLMLGYGFDPVIARFFGGFWQEDMGFAGGRGIAFTIGVMGFLVSYIMGIAYIIWAKRKGMVSIYPADEDSSVFSGIISQKQEKEEAGRITTDSQSIESFTLHLAIIGVIMLVVYSLMRAIGIWMVTTLDPGLMILGEVFMNYHFLFGFVLGLVTRKLIQYLTIDYILDEGSLSRINGILVDYMVVAAIVAIPLVITEISPWPTLVLALTGGAVTLLAVNWLSGMIFQDDSLEKRVALFGFLTGNISSSIALLRVVDPRLENPVARDLTYASGLLLFTSMPLIFLLNLPLIGVGWLYQIYTLLLMAIYFLIVFLVWRFVLKKFMSTPGVPSPKKRRGNV